MTTGGDEILPAYCLADREAGAAPGSWIAMHVGLTSMRHFEFLPPDLHASASYEGITVRGDLVGYSIEIATRGKGDIRISNRAFATMLERDGLLDPHWDGLTDDDVARLALNFLPDVLQDDAENLGYLPPFEMDEEGPETLE